MRRTVPNSSLGRVLGPIAVSLAAVACSASEEASPASSTTDAVAGGTVVAYGDFPAVGLVQLGRGYCTGTLVREDVVLTASHCLVGQETSTIRFRTAKAEFRRSETDEFLSADSDAIIVRKAKSVVAKEYKTAGGNGVSKDFGYILLEEPIRDIKPYRISRRGVPSDALSYVGFGIADNHSKDDYKKRSGNTWLVARRDDWFRTSTKSASTCPGDSGSPILAKSEDGNDFEVVGVHSAGTGKCGEGAQRSYNVDIGYWLAEIEADLGPL